MPPRGGGVRHCAALCIINNRINLSAVSTPAIKGPAPANQKRALSSVDSCCADNSAKLLKLPASPFYGHGLINRRSLGGVSSNTPPKQLSSDVTIVHNSIRRHFVPRHYVPGHILSRDNMSPGQYVPLGRHDLEGTLCPGRHIVPV